MNKLLNELFSLIYILTVFAAFLFVGRYSTDYIPTEKQNLLEAKAQDYDVLVKDYNEQFGKYYGTDNVEVRIIPIPLGEYMQRQQEDRPTEVLLQEIRCTHPAMSDFVYASRVLEDQGTAAREQFIQNACLVLNQLEEDFLEDYVPLPDLEDIPQQRGLPEIDPFRYFPGAVKVSAKKM